MYRSWNDWLLSAEAFRAFAMLSLGDLAALCITCRGLKQNIETDDDLWRAVASKELPEHPLFGAERGSFRAAHSAYQKLESTRSLPPASTTFRDCPRRASNQAPSACHEGWTVLSASGTLAAVIEKNAVSVWEVAEQDDRGHGGFLTKVLCRPFSSYVVDCWPKVVLKWGTGLSHCLLAIGDTASVRVISLPTGEVLQEAKHPIQLQYPYPQICWNMQGIQLAIAYEDSLMVYEGLPHACTLLCQQRVTVPPMMTRSLNNFAFSHDQQLILCCHREAYVYAADTLELVFVSGCERLGKEFMGAAFKPDSSQLAVLATEGPNPMAESSDSDNEEAMLMVVDCHTWFSSLWSVESRLFNGCSEDPFCIDLQWCPHPNSNSLSWLNAYGEFTEFDLDSRECREVGVDRLKRSEPGCLSWSPDGWHLAALDHDRVHIIDLVGWNVINTLLLPDDCSESDSDHEDGHRNRASGLGLHWSDCGRKLVVEIFDFSTGSIGAAVLEFSAEA